MGQADQLNEAEQLIEARLRVLALTLEAAGLALQQAAGAPVSGRLAEVDENLARAKNEWKRLEDQMTATIDG